MNSLCHVLEAKRCTEHVGAGRCQGFPMETLHGALIGTLNRFVPCQKLRLYAQFKSQGEPLGGALGTAQYLAKHSTQAIDLVCVCQRHYLGVDLLACCHRFFTCFLQRHDSALGHWNAESDVECISAPHALHLGNIRANGRLA